MDLTEFHGLFFSPFFMSHLLKRFLLGCCQGDDFILGTVARKLVYFYPQGEKELVGGENRKDILLKRP